MPGMSKKDLAEAIDDYDLMISPMVQLEIQFLYEVERIREKPEVLIKTVAADFGIAVCNDTFKSVADSAASFHWTRDPFDRLIVA